MVGCEKVVSDDLVGEVELGLSDARGVSADLDVGIEEPIGVIVDG